MKWLKREKKIMTLQAEMTKNRRKKRKLHYKQQKSREGETEMTKMREKDN